ncbi:two-component system, CitB family, response regulator CitT [Terribacillus halophilus]|uniref:Two-component system, CitB family, response regulator CitT n=1 Tax=Terribacillus halophilus TaxID=361279 RepID=A0A1G6IRM3_9BACI|nr:response regulator [Terribacillus halophilus]SDC09070.1 two-component system, CitB family, response regulator CitT [Terribacillus halophilus]
MCQVIIAEDDFRVAQIHEEFLNSMKGLKLIGKAGNAKETLQLLEKHDVDLLLLDVYMPDQLGTELLPVIRQLHPRVDIILITAATDKTFLERALSYGVRDYLIKPATMEQFKDSLSRYLKKREMLQSTSEINKEIIEQVFGAHHPEQSVVPLPTGIDFRTLEKIKKLLEQEHDGITSEKAGKKIGVSRTTARRYLEYLVGTEEVKVEQVYGIVGRPERRYCLDDQSDMR